MCIILITIGIFRRKPAVYINRRIVDLRIVYALSLLFLSVSSVLFVWKVRKEDGLTVYIRRFILCSVVAMSSCIVSSYSQHETLSMVCYGLYFASKAWLTLFFCQFILAYTDNSSKIADAVLIIFAVFVSIHAILNLKFHQAFSVRELIWVTDGNRYLVTVPGLWYKILLGTGFVFLGFCVICLIVKTLETPKAYRVRYLVMLFMMAVLVCLNAAFLIFNIPMDWSALFYTAFAIVAWFFSTRYIKTFLLSRTLAVIVDRLDTGLVIFDYKDAPVYVNDRGASMLDTDMAGVPELLEKWYGTKKASGLKTNSREVEFSRFGAKFSYFVRFQELRDEAGVYNGGFFAIRDITADKEKERQEQYNNEHDRLTNLYIQKPFYRECKQLLKQNPQEQYIMIRTETEVFDSIRSIYGKDTRDAVIAGFGAIIRRTCRGRGVGGWMNDESFGLLIPVSDFSEKKMTVDVSETFAEILGDNARTFRVRVGICPAENRLSSAQTLADQAKVALGYIMNDENTVASWYTEGMRQKGLFDSNLTDSLAEATENGELKMYLQPMLGPGKKGVIGAEALIRWHKDGKVLLPGEFLPLLEKNELIAAVDLFIWEQAVKQLAKWKEEGKKNLFVAVNVARKDLYLLDICGEFSRLLKSYDVDPSHIHVDISSEMMYLEKHHLIGIVRQLKEKGVHVNLDNFGGYYTAPVFLRDIRFDGIKISRELVREVESDATGKAIAKSIVDMGRNLEVSVYAEGVETEREYKALVAMGCDGYQGFFISEPVPAENFEQSSLLK